MDSIAVSLGVFDVSVHTFISLPFVSFDQVVPHVSDAIQEWVLKVAQTPVQTFSENESNNSESMDSAPEVCIVELGGTLGDIESMPFVEAVSCILLLIHQYSREDSTIIQFLGKISDNLVCKSLCFDTMQSLVTSAARKCRIQKYVLRTCIINTCSGRST